MNAPIKLSPADTARLILKEGGDIATRVLELPDNLKGKVAEILVAKAYRQQGFLASVTGQANDGGVDCVVTINDRRVGVQVKAQKSPMTPKQVRAEYATYREVGKQLHNLDSYIVMSLSGFNGAIPAYLSTYVNQSQVTLLTGHDLNRLLQQVKPARTLELSNHNLQNYSLVMDALSRNKSCIYTSATGTGKSYIAGSVAIALASEGKTLVVTPNDVINRQHKNLLDDYLDSVDTTTTTGLLYNKTLMGYDLIILDEVHRAGADKWGQAIKSLLNTNPQAKILGLTATPERTDLKEIIGLFDAHIEGNTLTQAIAAGILPTPDYHHGFIGLEEQLQKLREEGIDTSELDTLYHAQGIIPTLKWVQADRAGTVAHLFCSDIQSAKTLERMIQDARDAGILKKVRALRFDSATASNANELIHSVNNHSGKDLLVVVSVNKLSEGLHLERETPTVILYRSTKSHIVCSQQIGRAFTTSGEHKPLIIDLASVLDTAGTAVSASAVQKAYADIVDAETMWLGNTTPAFPAPVIGGNWLDAEAFASKLADMEIRVRASRGETMARAIVQYVEKYGKKPYDSASSTTEAGRLENMLKHNFRKLILDNKRDFYPESVWSILESNEILMEYLNKQKVGDLTLYGERCNIINQFAIENGRIPVDGEQIDGWNAGGWADKQRQNFKAGSLSQEQIALCESISGWYWVSDRHKVACLTKVTCSCCGQLMNLRSSNGHTANQRRKGTPAVVTKLPMNQQPELLDYFESIAVKKGFYSQWKKEKCNA